MNRDQLILADQARKTAAVEPDDATTPGSGIVRFVVMADGMKASVITSELLMREIRGSEGIIARALILAIGDDAITTRTTGVENGEDRG